MNLALISRYVHALVNAVENSSALSLADVSEGVSHDFFTRSLHHSGHWLRLLVLLVQRISKSGG
jgi:hypothetical protein